MFGNVGSVPNQLVCVGVVLWMARTPLTLAQTGNPIIATTTDNFSIIKGVPLIGAWACSLGGAFGLRMTFYEPIQGSVEANRDPIRENTGQSYFVFVVTIQARLLL